MNRRGATGVGGVGYRDKQGRAGTNRDVVFAGGAQSLAPAAAARDCRPPKIRFAPRYRYIQTKRVQSLHDDDCDYDDDYDYDYDYDYELMLYSPVQFCDYLIHFIYDVYTKHGFLNRSRPMCIPKRDFPKISA